MYIRHFTFITFTVSLLVALGGSLNNYTFKEPTPIAKADEDEVKYCFGTQLPTGYSVHGLDVSHYQEKVNWASICSNKVDSNGLSFVFIRSTMGSDRTDATFRENWKAAKRVGLVRAAYHYFDPRQNAPMQARNFLRNTKIEAGDLPPVLDIEVRRFRRKKDIVAFQNAVRIWLVQVEKKTGIRPIIYSAYKFYHDYLAKKFSNYPVWIAYYNPTNTPELNTNQQWHFWQHSDKGRIDGIKGFVDLNVFNGSLEDLQGLCIPHPTKKRITAKNSTRSYGLDGRSRPRGVVE